MSELSELVARALAEDLGEGDVTSDSVVPPDARARARIVQKQPGVVYGLDAAEEAFRQTGAAAVERLAAEAEWADVVPREVAAVEGAARALLAAERTALNLLCHLSGVATLTAWFAREVEGTGARVLDTRKTLPGLRALEKAAVAAGGGSNHRMGLYDAILIKENHVAIAGGIGEAVRRARAAHPELPVEIECRDAAEVAAALDAGADRLLLDNMGPDELRASVAARDAAAAAATLEASGGITLANVAGIAATGVEFVSVGALTHSAPALDLSMLIDAGLSEGTDPNIELLRPTYKQWGRGNWDAHPPYGPGMEWEWSDEFLDIGGSTRDPDVASDRLRLFISQWDDWRTEPQGFIPAGDKIVVLLHYSGTGKGSGAEIHHDGAHVWTMRDGRAVRLQIFAAPSRALEAAGLPPDA